MVGAYNWGDVYLGGLITGGTYMVGAYNWGDVFGGGL